MIILIFNILHAFSCFKPFNVPEQDTRDYIIQNVHASFFNIPEIANWQQDMLIAVTPSESLWKTRCYDRTCDNGGICERYTSLTVMSYTQTCICKSPWEGKFYLTVKFQAGSVEPMTP